LAKPISENRNVVHFPRKNREKRLERGIREVRTPEAKLGVRGTKGGGDYERTPEGIIRLKDGQPSFLFERLYDVRKNKRKRRKRGGKRTIEKNECRLQSEGKKRARTRGHARRLGKGIEGWILDASTRRRSLTVKQK